MEGKVGGTKQLKKLKIHIHIEVRNLTARFHNPQRLCSRTLSCSVIKVSLSPIHMVKSQSSWRELLKPSASLETPWRAHQKYDTSSEAGRVRKKTYCTTCGIIKDRKTPTNPDFMKVRSFKWNLTGKIYKNTQASVRESGRIPLPIAEKHFY